MVKLLSSGALLASLCRAAAVANSQCSVVTASKQQSCPALLIIRMVHSKCRGETYKYGKDEVKGTKSFRRYIYTPLCNSWSSSRLNDVSVLLLFSFPLSSSSSHLFVFLFFSPLLLICVFYLLSLTSSSSCLLFVSVFFLFLSSYSSS